MKQEPLNRKHKEALSAHFSRGGNVNNVPAELQRVSIQDRLACYEFWKKRKAT